jgi:hypothetical protein
MLQAPVSSADGEAGSRLAQILVQPMNALAPFFEMQRLQFAAVLAWQESLAAMTSEILDQWAAHWAGGAPIDA